MGIKVFHGTNLVIEQPKIINRFKTLDFGEGFYTTENENQAREFAVKVCERRSLLLDPIVNCYEFNEDFDKYSVLKFDSPNEKWFDFVIERRKGRFKIKKLFNQIVFCNEFILSNLTFVKSYKVKVKNER